MGIDGLLAAVEKEADVGEVFGIKQLQQSSFESSILTRHLPTPVSVTTHSGKQI